MQQIQLPQGFPPPPPPGTTGSPLNVGGGLPGIPGLGGAGAGIPGLGEDFGGAVGAGSNGASGSVRRRGPLPPQSEGFKMEQARGNFRVAR